jgi:hypothetical protein
MDLDLIRSVDPYQDLESGTESPGRQKLSIKIEKIKKLTIHKNRKNYEISCSEVLDVFFEAEASFVA